jgi:Ca-activated chloride channel family protein
MKRRLSGLIACWLLVGSLPCMGQGILLSIDPAPTPLPRPIVRPNVPPPTQSYKIKQLAVHTRIADQVARVQVTQSFVNTGSATMEVSFCFPLPYDGAVNQMTFLVDGKEYEAKLLPAAEARDIYLSHVRRNQDPALLEWLGTGMFKTSVFPIPPGAERKVSIQLTQLLRKSDRLTDFLYPLSTARFTSQPVETLSLSATIESKSKIKSVYSPTHAIDVKRPDDYRAVVSMEVKNTIPTNDFRMMYDTAPSEVGASLIS